MVGFGANGQHQLPLAFGQCNGFFHTLLSRQRPDLLHSLYKMLRDILLPLLRYRLRVREGEAEKGKEKKKQDEMVEMQIVYFHIFQAINLDKFNYFLFFSTGFGFHSFFGATHRDRCKNPLLPKHSPDPQCGILGFAAVSRSILHPVRTVHSPQTNLHGQKDLFPDDSLNRWRFSYSNKADCGMENGMKPSSGFYPVDSCRWQAVAWPPCSLTFRWATHFGLPP